MTTTARTAADRMTAADMIRQLIRPYATHERGTFSLPHRVPVPSSSDPNAWTTIVRPATHHTAMHPALLDQLAGAAGTRSALSDDDAGPASFGSKPAAHLEALRLLDRITHQSRRLEQHLGLDPTPNLRDRLSRIGGRLGINPDPQVRSWWAAARILTHWDTPAYRPSGAPCPACWETGTIQVRFDDEIAVCTECDSVWDREGGTDNGSLDMLGQHVAWCTDHDVTRARHLRVDDAGRLVDCEDCAPFRAAFAAWRADRDTEQRTPARDPLCSGT